MDVEGGVDVDVEGGVDVDVEGGVGVDVRGARKSYWVSGVSLAIRLIGGVAGEISSLDPARLPAECQTEGCL